MEWTNIAALLSAVTSISGLILGWLSFIKQRGKDGGTFKQWLRQIKESYPFILGIALGITAMVFTFVEIGEPTLNITHPEDTTSVSFVTAVSGSSSHIPAGSSIWICVLTPDNRYYPQSGPVTPATDGQWMTTVSVGMDGEDIGKQFGILVILADEEGNIDLLDYQQESEQTEKWLGMNSLPRGAEVHDQITVIRE